MGFINNQRFKTIKLGVCTITVEDDKGNKREIKNNDFQKIFSCRVWMHCTFIPGHVNR
jgi:hypothetical protein